MVVEEKERAQQLPVERLCARSERGGRRRPREISRWGLAPGRPLFSVLVRVGWEGQGKNDGKNEGGRAEHARVYLKWRPFVFLFRFV